MGAMSYDTQIARLVDRYSFPSMGAKASSHLILDCTMIMWPFDILAKLRATAGRGMCGL